MMTQGTTPRSGLSQRAKGLVAIGAGAALLLGGGSTLAYWSISQSVAGADITAGDLNLELGTAAWTLNGEAFTGSIADLRIVPGDTLVLNQPLDITLVGDNLEANLTADVAGLTNTTEHVTVTSGFTGVPAGVLTQDSAFTDPALQVTVAFDAAADNRDDATATINLSALTVDLEQVTNP